MQHALNKLRGVWRAIVREPKQSAKAGLEKEMVKNSITSGPIGLEVWIMSGLLSSLVLQIVAGSLKQRLGVKPGTTTENE
jgi:hypothetical protein